MEKSENPVILCTNILFEMKTFGLKKIWQWGMEEIA
jgi:hypothetical protein